MARPKTRDLTDRQREVFEWVREFAVEQGMPPTVSEIARAFGIKKSTTFGLLKEIERKGYLRRGDRGARSLIFTRKDGEARPCCQDLPVLGKIAAGEPILAVEDDQGTVPVQRSMLRGHDGYVLRVEGDSMIDAGILDGDDVIVRRQDTADDGDIVVALIEDEATLKRFYRDGDTVRLEPSNPGMSAITVDSGEFRIQGKVVGVHRNLDRRG